MLFTGTDGQQLEGADMKERMPRIEARLAEMEAYMQQERDSISRQLVREQDDAVRQTEAAYTGRLNGVRADAARWLEDFQREAAEFIGNAKNTVDGAQREINLAKQKEVSCIPTPTQA